VSWSTAMLDWEERIIAGKSITPSLPLFPKETMLALNFFSKLPLCDVPGKPKIGDMCGQWLLDLVSAVFGSYDEESGIRMLQKFFVLIGKKNSKSTGAGLLMLTALIRNRREGGEYLIISPTKTIADNSFNPTAAAIRSVPALDTRFHIQDHFRLITDRRTGAKLQIKAADTEVVGGQKAVGILVDELWLFGQMAKGELVMSEIEGSLAARPDGFIIYLSTQSDVPPAGIFLKKLAHHRDVRDGLRTDARAFQLMYEFPKSLLKDDRWMQECYWKIPNPNLGKSVDIDWLRNELANKIEDGKDSLELFAAKHFNIELGMARRSNRWVGADSWPDAVEPGLTFEEILERSEVVTIGVDGGGADDLLGVAMIGREKETKRWLHWAHAWMHPLALARRKSNRTEYDELIRLKQLTLIEDYPEDLEGVVDIAKRAQAAGKLAAVGMDRIGLDQAVDAFAEIGLTEEDKTLFGIPQGYVLTGAIKSMERKLIDRSFVHGGQRLMNWAVGNAKVEPTKNAFLITKQASGTAKIDPLMATFDAAYLMGRNPEPKRTPEYQLIFA
jgi:phage terminase large subunit-like protein